MVLSKFGDSNSLAVPLGKLDTGWCVSGSNLEFFCISTSIPPTAHLGHEKAGGTPPDLTEGFPWISSKPRSGFGARFPGPKTVLKKGPDIRRAILSPTVGDKIDRRFLDPFFVRDFGACFGRGWGQLRIAIGGA